MKSSFETKGRIQFFRVTLSRFNCEMLAGRVKFANLKFCSMLRVLISTMIASTIECKSTKSCGNIVL